VRVLGLDASLTNFGWAMHDTEAPAGDAGRCLSRGLFQTPASMEFIERYVTQRERLKKLIQEQKPDKVGLEFPVFDNLFSEGMYGLFLFTCEALKTEGQDVVFWSPLQVKAHARELLGRPKSWVMDKVDMVEAAKKDASGAKWNHNEADAYHVARLAGRFWELHSGYITELTLTEIERKYFTEIKKYVRGKKAGKEEKKGVIYREDDRFFQWSKE
jgi:Holliday junction resolvasome RuvABC endonuclease subunit